MKIGARLITGLILFAGMSLGLDAQDATVYGYLRSEDDQPLPFANIAVKGTTTGTSSNDKGYFAMTVQAEKPVTLLISLIGYAHDSITVLLRNGERKELLMVMKATATELSTIEVKDQQLRTSSFNRLDPKAITLIPTINAAVEDLIKTLPGVSSRDELSSQYSVRGGNYDENLSFVNDIEVYRPFLIRSGQQEGQSFLNPDLVSGISFSAGGFDARYGDKMSSVLDIKYRKPVAFAGSFDISLLGANAHVEGTFARQRFSYLLGVRYKTNSYFLNAMETKGNYKPRFFDVQGMLNYEINRKWELSFLGNFTDNFFKLIPTTRETSFGTLDEAYKIMIYFDGYEVDRYQNWLTALTLGWKPWPALRLKLIGSVYQTYEAETYDISGEYWMGKLETQKEEAGQITEILGVGAYLDHARNYLNGTVFNLEHRGNWEQGRSQMIWGVKYEHCLFDYAVSEWELQDSAGYSLPRPPDSLGSNNPPHDPLELRNVVRGKNTVNSNKLSAFIQDSWTFNTTHSDISITAGLRGIYYDYNGQISVNPRINISFRPKWKKDVVFRITGGIYSQPPTFREMTDLTGQVVPDLKAQTAVHGVAGCDLYFRAWGRPFKFVTEVYYKYIQNLIPYEIDNLKIRYYGTNDAHGYAAGIDLRVNGEFVKGVESWASFSIMQTEEYFEGSWIPRPTDQRINLAIFFQDYIPKFPTWKVNLTLIYGTGLPFGPPDSPRNEQTLRMPPYRRVDIGLSKQLISEKTRFKPKNPFRVFDSMWISLEIFNLFQFNNTISYLWITDINNRQYAVPNYLTPRMFNLKLIAEF